MQQAYLCQLGPGDPLPFPSAWSADPVTAPGGLGLTFLFFFGNLFSPLTIGKLPTYLTGLVTVRPAQIQVVKLCLCFSIFCLQVLPLNRGGGGNTAVEATAVVLLHVQSLISGLEHELGA